LPAAQAGTASTTNSENRRGISCKLHRRRTPQATCHDSQGSGAFSQFPAGSGFFKSRRALLGRAPTQPLCPCKMTSVKMLLPPRAQESDKNNSIRLSGS
jgi:hypothetical protein